MLDLSWETAFAAKNETAEELLASVRLVCHRDDIPERARPVLNKLLKMKTKLDKAEASAFLKENVKASDEEKEVSSVTIQSTSVSYLTSEKNPYSNQAKGAKALAKLQADYDALFTRLVHSIRRFPRTSSTPRDVYTL